MNVFLQFNEQPPSSTIKRFHQRQDHVSVASLSSDIVPFVIDTISSFALWKNINGNLCEAIACLIMSRVSKKLEKR